jgi:hypothetical protein
MYKDISTTIEIDRGDGQMIEFTQLHQPVGIADGLAYFRAARNAGNGVDFAECVVGMLEEYATDGGWRKLANAHAIKLATAMVNASPKSSAT